jgi:hypothetical protein
LVLRFALNARELSSHALGWQADNCRRAARQGFALPRRISSPPRKSRFALAYAPASMSPQDVGASIYLQGLLTVP